LCLKGIVPLTKSHYTSKPNTHIIFSPFVSAVIRGWLARKQFNSMHKMKLLTHENSNSKRKPGKKISEVKVHIGVVITFQLDLFFIFPIC